MGWRLEEGKLARPCCGNSGSKPTVWDGDAKTTKKREKSGSSFVPSSLRGMVTQSANKYHSLYPTSSKPTAWDGSRSGCGNCMAHLLYGLFHFVPSPLGGMVKHVVPPLQVLFLLLYWSKPTVWDGDNGLVGVMLLSRLSGSKPTVWDGNMTISGLA